jgi:DNA processing protein
LYKKGYGKIGKKNIGVVGTRKITAYGRSATEKITKELCEGNVCIVSGLAEGVDAAAHEKSLNLGNKTVAVVGSGLDVIYPNINKKIWERISEEGIIFSEYPPGTEPLRWNFPARNRIIVGLSKGIVVTESYKNGGALITAGLALEESRDVFAVPGFINYPSYEGCNNIIKKGEAKLVTSGYDILEEYGWEKNIKEEENNIKLNPKEMSIYGAVTGEKDLDEIADEVKMMPSEILAILMEMEIKGIIKSIPGGRYKTIKII